MVKMASNSLKCILNTPFETKKRVEIFTLFFGNFHAFLEIFTHFWKFSHIFGNFHTFLEPFPNVIVNHQYNKEAYLIQVK